MTLRIDEATKRAAELRNRLSDGEAAIKALQWLSQPDLQKLACLRVSSDWGSVHDGNKAALQYINAELTRIAPEIIEKAKRMAQQDMDTCLGYQKGKG